MEISTNKPKVILALVLVYIAFQVFSAVYSYNFSVQQGDEIAIFAKDNMTIAAMWLSIIKIVLLGIASFLLVFRNVHSVFLFVLLFAFELSVDLYGMYQFMFFVQAPLTTSDVLIMLVALVSTFVVYGGLSFYSITLRKQGYFVNA